MEWVRRWDVTIEWARPEDSPWHTVKLVKRVDTPAELRSWVERARADRFVTAVKHTSVRELVGELPAACPAGHPYPRGGSFGASRHRRWLLCDCGGHHELTCPRCGVVVVDPVATVGCDLAH